MSFTYIKAVYFGLCAAMLAPVIDVNAAESPHGKGPSKADYVRIAGEVEANLHNHILDKFFPAAADEKGGGFFENYGLDWTRLPGGAKSIVYQSRLTWTSAQAAMRFPDKREMYLAMTRRGAKCLAENMWDRHAGGFFWTIPFAGDQPTNAVKQMYGHAFGIYALATSYQATKDQGALDLAKKAFLWMEDYAHDRVHLGYFENVGPDGKPANSMQGNAVGAGVGQKSMNTSIHILEALTALYRAWPDPVVKQRVQEMLEICRTRFYSDPGYLIQYVGTDWQRTDSSDSFGHDVETGFLMVEAAEALGQGDDSRYWSAARNLVDHAMQYGWDKERGGLYDSGSLDTKGIGTGQLNTEKIWWVQAEHLNALLLQHERLRKETNEYWDAFVKEWEWITKYQVDSIHGGWWRTVRADGAPESRLKADMWTECYHQARAMFVVSDRLRQLADN